MNGDQTGHKDRAAIEHVEDEDETDVNVEDGPETRAKEKVEDEGSIDKEAKGTKKNKYGNIEDGF